MILPDELVDVSIIHPLRNHRKFVLADSHPKQRQDVGMPEMLPGNHLSAESLRYVDTGEWGAVTGRSLTLRMVLRLVVNTWRTLTATWCPSYVLCDTLAQPPMYWT